MKIKYVIYDWAGNEMFNGKSFKTFEDAWDYLYEVFPDEEDDFYGEYQVLDKPAK
jgi:formylmethanofuran dehydrogenase subunit C